MAHDALFGTDGVRGLANGRPHRRAGPRPVRRRRPRAGRGRCRSRGTGRSPSSAATPGSPGSSSRPRSWPGWPPPGSTSSCSVCCRRPASPTSPARSAPTSASMLSASHNPMPDNGIKFLARGGRKLDDADRGRDRAAAGRDLAAPDRRRGRPGLDRTPPPSTSTSPTWSAPSTSRWPGSRSCSTAPTAPPPRSVRARCATPAPRWSRSAPSPTASTSTTAAARRTSDPLRAAVLEHGADVGFALDGDADRCLAVDADGAIVDGDQILAILALAMREQGAPQRRHRGGDGDEQPRLRAGDARRTASASGRPRSATATCSRR